MFKRMAAMLIPKHPRDITSWLFTSDTIMREMHMIPTIMCCVTSLSLGVYTIIHSCSKLDCEWTRKGHQPKWEYVDLRKPPYMHMYNPCGKPYPPMPELQALREEIGVISHDPCNK